MIGRRRVLLLGAGAAALALAGGAARARGTVDVGMASSDDGARVRFDPLGIRIRPGQTVRWVNDDPRNAHTATAYHPANLDRPRRIPGSAQPWDSDYLLPGESFSVMLGAPGVYDYFCVPHEAAGMVGRIVVGDPGPGEPDWPGGGDLPPAALAALPPVSEILRRGAVGAGEGGG